MNRRGGSIISLLPVLAAVMGTTGIVASYSHFQMTVEPVDVAVQLDVATQPEANDYVQLASATTVSSQDDDNLARRLRSFGLRLSSDGKLPGRITLIDPQTGERIIAEDVSVKFVQRGSIIQTVKPGLNGVFQASGIQPGIYSIIVAGKDGFMGFSARVLPAGNDLAEVTADDNQIHLTGYSSAQNDSGLQVDGAAVPRRDFRPLKEIVDVYLPRVGYSKIHRSTKPLNHSNVKLVSAQTDGEQSDDKTSVPPVPTPATTNDEGTTGEGVNVEGNESKLTNVDATPATHNKSHAVRLTAAGDLAGRIRRLSPQTGRPMPVRRMNVFLLNNGELYTQSTVRENGTFLFRDVPAGVYSFVAASSEGFLAFGVELVSSSVDTRTASLDIPAELVANIFAMQDGTEFEGSIIPPEDSEIVRDEVDNLPEEDEEEDDEEGVPPADGGAAGGTTGGGAVGGGGVGGGGGGGLLGAALGAGVGAAVGAAIADNNNNETSP